MIKCAFHCGWSMHATQRRPGLIRMSDPRMMPLGCKPKSPTHWWSGCDPATRFTMNESLMCALRHSRRLFWPHAYDDESDDDSDRDLNKPMHGDNPRRN